jgi:hypothetical protein
MLQYINTFIDTNKKKTSYIRICVGDRGSCSLSHLKNKTKISVKDAADETDENIRSIFISYGTGMLHCSNC